MRNAFILAFVFIAGAVITGYSGMDGMKGGYALIAGFGFAALCAFITALFYRPRARAFDRLLQDLHPLAHWTYTDEEWKQYISENYRESLSINKSTMKLVVIIATVVGLVLLLIYRDRLFISITAAIILLLAIVAFTVPLLQRGKLRKGMHEAYIGEHAAFVGGSFQTWDQTGVRLSAADIYTDAPIPMIHLVLESPTLQGMQQNIFRVPVPAGKLDEAKSVLNKLTGH